MLFFPVSRKFRGSVSRALIGSLTALFCAQTLTAGIAYADDLVRISSLTDISVPLWVTGDPEVAETVLVCVYHTVAATYALKAVGDGPGFFLHNGSYTMPYSVKWNDGGALNPAGGSTAVLTNNVKLASLNNARIETDAPSSSSDCNSGANPTAQLTITISQVDLDSALDGTYTGVLTLYLTAS